jgi:hypothetical protein
MVMLDLVVENMDIPNREEIVRRIRAMNGQRDPDADEPTPEELEQQKASAEQQQIQQAMVMAQLRNLLATAAKTEAQAKDLMAKIAGTKVDTQGRAILAARDVIMTPGVVPVADQILHESEFESRTEMEAAANAARAQQQAQVQQQQQLPQPQEAAPAGAVPGA